MSPAIDVLVWNNKGLIEASASGDHQPPESAPHSFRHGDIDLRLEGSCMPAEPALTLVSTCLQRHACRICVPLHLEIVFTLCIAGRQPVGSHNSAHNCHDTERGS